MSNPIVSYADACRYLDDLQMHKIKLGLEAVRDTLAGLGSPELRCPAVHVAGTNGKGSVCSMLRSILTAAGYKTGLYTSPHLSSVRERFRIDEHFINRTDFTRLMERIRQHLGDDKITYFECTTALAFSWFAENNCDLVILETGMGGRLDATNVITPLVSVITTISLDHEQYLGDTVEEVAFEKAGIIKDRIPVISGVLEEGSRSVIERVCQEREAPVITREIDFTLESVGQSEWTWQARDKSVRIDGLSGGRNGAWQQENTACAVAAAVVLRKGDYRIEDQAIRDGLKNSRWPGRMEYLELDEQRNGAVLPVSLSGKKIRYLLDGAHNQAGVSHLVNTLASQFSYQRLLVIWAAMADKNYQGILREIAEQADVLMLTRPESERSATPGDLARALGGQYHKDLLCLNSVRDAFEQSISLAGPNDLVLVAGSLYLVGEFRKLLMGEVVS